jgi:NDP-sugar pyrophosphorylase family protein
MAVREVPDTGRYGTVLTTAAGRLIGFEEKTCTSTPGLINAGIYVFGQGIFEHIPDGPASLERQVFPRIIDVGVYALIHRGLFIDIGTPEDYARAQSLSEQLRKATGRPADTACSLVQEESK